MRTNRKGGQVVRLERGRADMRDTGTEGMGIGERTEREGAKEKSERGLGYFQRLTPHRQYT